MTVSTLTNLADRHRVLLDQTLADLFETELAEWSAVHPVLRQAVLDLRDVVSSGGKRIRPLLCYLTYAGLGGPDDAPVARACAALELLHTFAIVQDDVMDGSALRRGVPALHVTQARRHTAAGWHGDPARYGESTSALVADLAFVYADQLMRGYAGNARAVFDRLRVEVVMGQTLDLYAGCRRVPDEALARLVVCYKTAKYTVERPMHLGAVVAGAGERVLLAVSRFAVPLGSAFQLRDDLLGVFGDEGVTGKSAVADFRQGKQTLVWTFAMAAATPAERAVLERCGSPAFGPADADRVREILVSTGAVDRVEADVAELLAVADAALDDVPGEPGAVAALRELAVAMVYRDR